MEKGNKKRRVQLFALVVILLVVILLIWVYFRPSNVVNSGVRKLSDSKTQSFSANVRLENPELTQTLFGEPAIIELVVDGAYRKEDDQRNSFIGDLVIGAKTESITMQAEADVRMIGDKAYLLVEKAPPSLTPLAQLKGQWFEMPRNDELQESQITEDEDLLQDIQSIGKLSVNGKAVKAYQANVTPIGILKILDSLANVLGNRLTQEQVEEFRSGVASVDSIPVTFAISPLTRDVKQIGTTFDLPGGNNQVTLVITFIDRNGKVEIEVPEGVTTFQAFAESLSVQ